MRPYRQSYSQPFLYSDRYYPFYQGLPPHLTLAKLKLGNHHVPVAFVAPTPQALSSARSCFARCVLARPSPCLLFPSLGQAVWLAMGHKPLLAHQNDHKTHANRP